MGSQMSLTLMLPDTDPFSIDAGGIGVRPASVRHGDIQCCQSSPPFSRPGTYGEKFLYASKLVGSRFRKKVYELKYKEVYLVPTKCSLDTHSLSNPLTEVGYSSDSSDDILHSTPQLQAIALPAPPDFRPRIPPVPPHVPQPPPEPPDSPPAHNNVSEDEQETAGTDHQSSEEESPLADFNRCHTLANIFEGLSLKFTERKLSGFCINHHVLL